MSNRNNIESSIKKSHEAILENQKQFHIYKSLLPVFIKDELPEGFNIKGVFQAIERMVPEHLFYNIDLIIVGDFEEFHKRQVNALYQNGAIYVTNEQANETDMVDDIIHELAHATEETNIEIIYGDGALEREFLGKRKRLLDILNQEGYNILGYDLLDPNFSLELDQFLFSEIGYPSLTSLTMGLFVSPYGITSLSEYFANGFEKYLMKFENRKYLKNISPFLHTKIEEVIEGE